MIPIYIPTYGRVNKQVAWDQMPEGQRLRARLVVAPAEASAHVQKGRNVLACPVQGQGPSVVRDWLLDYAYTHQQERIIVIDDDVKIQVRDERYKIWDATPEEYHDAIDWLSAQLDEVPLAGLSARSLNFDKPGEHVEAGRQVSVHAIDVAELMKYGIRHELPYMEDFHLVLQLLFKGIPNRVSLRYRYTNGVSNAPGGCSTMRTLEAHNEAARMLAAKFPEVVKLRTKQNVWKGMTQATQDVTIQWVKALKLGKLRNK